MAIAEQETVVPELVSQAEGVVLELGPGSGMQLPRYDKSKISKVYGIEPNFHLHQALRASVKEARLDDVYVVVPHGAEEVKVFEGYGIVPNSVDTILSTQVLCCVPNPTETVRHLYRYLKPGGKMIVYEHVQSKDFVTKTVQSELLWHSVFSFLGCLCKKT